MSFKTTQIGDHRLINVPLNQLLADRELNVSSPYIYILNCPIVVTAKVGKTSNDGLPLQRVKVIKGQDGEKITKLYLTSIATTSNTLDILLADEDIIGQIGIANEVSLVTEFGVAYTAGSINASDSEIFNEALNGTGTTNGTAFDFSEYSKAVISWLSNLDVGTVMQIQGSHDSVTWYDLGDPISFVGGTESDYRTVSDAWHYLRIQCVTAVANTSGSLVVDLTTK